VSRILIVDDEANVRAALQAILEREGFECVTATDGVVGLELARRGRVDLVILDLVLPGLDGHEVCRRLRQNQATAQTPIIMMTGIGDRMDRIMGLELGADDFIEKPVDHRELTARVRAVLRRTERGHAESPARVGSLEIDAPRRQVRVEGATIELTLTEFDLLVALVRDAGQVVTRGQLLARLWGLDDATTTSSRTVDFHVSRLREKLGPEGKRIVTVRGMGYRFDAGE
jgi:DNA-binding response OmpR family regulator